MNNQQYDSYVESVAQELIDQMEKGQAPWQRPWEGGNFVPINATTEKPYNGMNAVRLLCVQHAKGYKDRRWLTFNQAQSLGGHVRKGEKGIGCIYWKSVYLETDDNEKAPTAGEMNRPYRMIPCRFTVFNAEQFNGLVLEKEVKPDHQWSPIESAERILKNSGANIQEKEQSQAYYSKEIDMIVLPARQQFPSASEFYDTALHELGHWTGHPSRLNRVLSGSFGTEEYAKEELRAEISSMMVSMSIGLPHNVERHSAYVGSWIQALKNDPKEIFRAATDAEKIKNFVLKYEKEYFYVLDIQNNTAQYIDKDSVIALVDKSLKTPEQREAFERLVSLETEKTGDPEAALFNVSKTFLDPREENNQNLLLNDHKGIVVTTDPKAFISLSYSSSETLFHEATYVVKRFESEEVIESVLGTQLHRHEASERNWSMLEKFTEGQNHALPSSKPSPKQYFVCDLATMEFKTASHEQLESLVMQTFAEYPHIRERLDAITDRFKNNPYKERTNSQARYEAIRTCLNPGTGPLSHGILGRLQHPGFIICDDPKTFLAEVSMKSDEEFEKTIKFLKDKDERLALHTAEVLTWRENVHFADPDYFAKQVHAKHYWKRLEDPQTKAITPPLQINKREFYWQPDSLKTTDNEPIYLVDYEKNTISECDKKSALEQSKLLLCDLVPSSSTQSEKVDRAFHPTIETQLQAVNELLNPGSKDNVCLQLNHRGIRICRDLDELTLACSVGEPSLKNQMVALRNERRLPPIEEKDNKDIKRIRNRIIAQRTWFKLRVQRHRKEKQKDDELMERLPHADKETMIAIQNEVQSRLVSLAQTLVQRKQMERQQNPLTNALRDNSHERTR